MTRWLVTGARGMLGTELVAALRRDPAAQVTAATRAELDITDPVAVNALVTGHDVVVNAAAYTDVDGAESDEDTAFAVNGHAVRTLAEACDLAGARLIAVSSDYVFDGEATAPYPEDWPTAPINAYGRSKLAGEQATLKVLPDTGYVVRTAWLYGAHGPNFITTMLRRAAASGPIDVVADQRGQPTWCRELARRLIALGQAAVADTAPAGVYHLTASSATTWHGLAQEVLAITGHDPARVRPITSERLARPARRPRHSVLGCERLRLAGLAPLPHWRDSLRHALTADGALR